jgi:thiamine phosphate synthase YjbQ (UPF0047 family)
MRVSAVWCNRLNEEHARPMHIHQSERTVATSAAPDFIDITDEVSQELAGCGVATGHVTVSAPPGCAIVINEFESGLISDLKRTIGNIADGDGRPVVGSGSVVVPATEGRLMLGRWQRLLLVELEQATTRSIAVQVVGDR